MSEQSKKALLVGGFLAIMLMAGGIYGSMMWLTPKINTWKKDGQELVDQTKELESEYDELVALEGRREEINAIRQLVEEKSRRLPPEEKIPEIINIIQQMLLVTGVDFTSFEQMEANQRLHYKEKPVMISCQAGFHMFGQFANLIEASPDRIMRIKEFDITINEELPDLHDINMTVAAYVVTKK